MRDEHNNDGPEDDLEDEATRDDGIDDDQPQTKLSSAFVVVLVLHIVAVIGIYVFKWAKAKDHATPHQPEVEEQGAPAAPEHEPAVLESTKPHAVHRVDFRERVQQPGSYESIVAQTKGTGTGHSQG